MKRKKIISTLLALSMLMGTVPAWAMENSAASDDAGRTQAESSICQEQEIGFNKPDGEEYTLIDENTVWSYLDDGTDPAGDSSAEGYERTSWTSPDYDDSGWKRASGPFGSKRGEAELQSGYTAATVLEGCDGENNTPAYFFRTSVNIDSLEEINMLKGTLQYDDGVIIYINGQRVTAFDDNACDESGTSLDKGFDANLQYGGSNGGTPAEVSFRITDLSPLHVGENIIAVELHNGRQTSSDLWINVKDISLVQETIEHQSDISLSMGANESQMNFTWHSDIMENAALLLAETADLVNGEMPADAQAAEVSVSETNEEGIYS